jgi:ethanolamine utilization cobalamin adenosyltransferase
VDGKADLHSIFELEQSFLDRYPDVQKYNTRKIAGGNVEKDILLTPERRELASRRRLGINKGRTPINKGVRLTPSALRYLKQTSAHRSTKVYIYDDMHNLVAVYPSINEAVRVERTQKNKFIAHIKCSTI